jgi:RNAse (barnase) inhibitor barstar
MRAEPAIATLAASLARRGALSDTVAELFEVGEWLVGLEILAAQAYEADLVFLEVELESAHEAVRHMGESLEATRALRTMGSAGPLGADGRYRTRVLTVAYIASDSGALHRGLQAALNFPDWYGCNWDAFWDAITGLVEMPHELVIWDWDVLRASLPRDARSMLECLLEAKRKAPATASTVYLTDSKGALIDPEREMDALRQ